MSFSISQSELEQKLREAIDSLNTAKTENFSTTLATRLESCDAGTLTMTCSYPTARWGANLIDRLHGGAVAGMLDQSMGLLCFAVCGRVPPTVELQISYLRPVMLDDRLFVKSRVLSAGRTFWHVICEAWMESFPEKPVASGTGIYFSAEYTK